jgi:hypothetical protein
MRERHSNKSQTTWARTDPGDGPSISGGGSTATVSQFTRWASQLFAFWPLPTSKVPRNRHIRAIFCQASCSSASCDHRAAGLPRGSAVYSLVYKFG